MEFIKNLLNNTEKIKFNIIIKEKECLDEHLEMNIFEIVDYLLKHKTKNITIEIE